MNATLSHLIREEDKPYSPGPKETKIIIKDDSGEILDRVSFFSACRCFIVRHQEIEPPVLETVANAPGSHQALNLRINYRIKPVPDREGTLVKSFYASPNYQNTLEGYLQSWCYGVAHQALNPMNQPAQFAINVAQHLESRASQIGLGLTAQVSILPNIGSPKEAPPPTHSVPPTPAPYPYAQSAAPSHPRADFDYAMNPPTPPPEPPVSIAREPLDNHVLQTPRSRPAGTPSPSYPLSDDPTPLTRTSSSGVIDMTLNLSFKDTAKTFGMNLHVVLDCTPAQVNLLGDVKSTILSSICSYCMAEVSLSEFLTQRDYLTDQIRAHVSRRVASLGFQIDEFSLEGLVVQVQQGQKIPLDLSYSIDLGEAQQFPLHVQAKLLFCLENPAKLFSSDRFQTQTFQHQQFLDWIQAEMTAFLHDRLPGRPLGEIEINLARLGDRNGGSFVDHLENLAEPFGYTWVIQEWHAEIHWDIPDHFTGFVTIEHELLDHQPVTLDNRVHMKLLERPKYIEAGLPALKPWITQILAKLIQQRLFRYNYSDLVLNFDKNLAEDIETSLKNKAATIGFKIETFEIQPRLTPLSWTRFFDITDRGKFPTSMPGRPIHMGIHITMRIPNLQADSIKPYIRPGVDLKEVIVRGLNNEMRALFYSLDPVRYYAGFDRETDGVTADNETTRFPPLRREIIERVKSYLENEFAAEVKNVDTKQEPDEVQERLDEISNQIAPFEFDFSPTGDIDNIRASGAIQAITIADKGWRLFLRKANLKLADMVQHMTKFLKSKLEGYAREDLITTTTTAHNQLEDELNAMINEYAVRRYGLEMELDHILMRSLYRAEKEWDLEQLKYETRLKLESRQYTQINHALDTQSNVDDLKREHLVQSVRKLYERIDRLLQRADSDPDALNQIQELLDFGDKRIHQVQSGMVPESTSAETVTNKGLPSADVQDPLS